MNRSKLVQVGLYERSTSFFSMYLLSLVMPSYTINQFSQSETQNYSEYHIRAMHFGTHSAIALIWTVLNVKWEKNTQYFTVYTLCFTVYWTC